MKNWIRWPGLIAFVVIFGGILGFWFVFADMLIEKGIEAAGSEINGAKVELASADLSLSPMGLELIGLEVTNPDAPMENAVDVSRIKFVIDPLGLIRRKIIIDGMVVDGVKFNTPRTTSGELTGSAKKRAEAKKAEAKKTAEKPSSEGSKDFCNDFTLPDTASLNVKDILSREKLQSLELINSAKADLEKKKAEWEKRLAELPDEKKLKSYEKKLKNVKSGGGLMGAIGAVSGGAKDLKELQADIKKIENAQKTFEKEIKEIEALMKKIEKAPTADFNRLKNKYGMSASGLNNMGRLVLGSKICGSLAKFEQWWQKARPYIAKAKKQAGKKDGKQKPVEVKQVRGKGVNVKFKEDRPVPDFLIVYLEASVILDVGTIKGWVKNITPDQDITGVPITFEFTGDKLTGVKKVTAQGSYNSINPADESGTLQVAIDQYQIKNMALNQGQTMEVLIKEAVADLDVNAVLKKENIDAVIDSKLKSIDLVVAKSQGTNPIVSAMTAAMSDVSSFNAKATVTGDYRNYDVKLKTDLDKVLQNAAGSILKKQAAQFNKKLRAGIMEKVKGPKNDLSNDKKGLDSIGGDMSDLSKMGNNLLKGSGGKLF